jgi:hypothetical protein
MSLLLVSELPLLALKIKSFDSSTGHFVISLADNLPVLAKLQALQDALLIHTKSNYNSWFQRNPIKKVNDIRTGFQPLIHGSDLHLYCPIQPQIAESVPFYSKGEWTGIQTGLLTTGTRLRIILRIQGLSFHIHPSTGQWSGKFRIQHKLLGLLLV